MNKADGFSLKLTLLLLLISAVLAGGGFIVYKKLNKKAPIAQVAQVEQPQAITSFEECVAAGNPVMESFPEQCSADGQTFVNAAQQAEETDSKGYVVVEDWGLKLKIGPNDQELQYRLERDAGHGDERLYIANAPSIAFMSANCGGDGFELVTISKTHEAEESAGAELVLEDDGHFYYVSSASGTCSEKPDEESAIRRGLVETAKTLTK